MRACVACGSLAVLGLDPQVLCRGGRQTATLLEPSSQETSMLALAARAGNLQGIVVVIALAAIAITIGAFVVAQINLGP